jgi:isopenicillin-N N-acyltransferase-like protein
MTLPFIEVTGTPYERGVTHGQEARTQIEGGLELYRELFAYFGGLSWDAALTAADQYRSVIESVDPGVYAEIVGIADGSGQPVEEVMALNCRSELLWRDESFASSSAAMECTSFGASVDCDGDNRVFIGQNWDWLAEARDTTIILGIRLEPLPAALLLTEAGMIGRLGMNSAGVGLATNTLISRRPSVGVPYNVLLRGILNQRSSQEALEFVTSSSRAVAAN